MSSDTGSGNTIKGIERGSNIVELLGEQGPLTLSEISEELDMPISTAHVYLKTLDKENFIVCSDHKYRLSLKFLRYGGQVLSGIDVYNAGMPALKDLAIQTGERAGLGVEENGKRVLIGIEDGMEALSDNISVGESTEMHWTGLGKCLLAHLSKSKREEIIEESSLPRATNHTITDPNELRQELALIREQGYAIENEERREGIRGVDVPILTPDGNLLGAIGLTGPVNRFDAAQLSHYVHILQNKSNVIKLKTVY